MPLTHSSAFSVPVAARVADGFQCSPLATLLVAADGRVLGANDVARETLAQSARPGATFESLFTIAKLGSMLLREALACGSAGSDAQIAGPDGVRWYRVDLRTNRGPDSAQMLVATCVPIDTRRAMEQRLRDSEKSLRSAIEYAAVALIVADARSGRLLLANAAAASLLRVDANDESRLRGRHRRSLHLVAERSVRRELVEALSTDLQRYGPEEVEIFDATGARRLVRLACQLLSFEGHYGCVASLVDIDELRGAQSLLERNLEQERQLNRMQRELVSMVSHELRTPMAVIDGSAQRLMRRAATVTPEDVAERCGRIRETVAGVGRMIDGLLEQSRLEAGATPMQPRLLNLTDLMRAAAARQQEVSPTHRIRVQIDPQFPSAYTADPLLVDRVVGNLLQNAVKYSPQGGEVSLEARAYAEHLEIRIRDQGLGIPAEELPRVFDRFFRASTSAGITGTGLGLHIVNQYVRMHGGHVEVSSEIGQGTSFTIHLPRSVEAGG